MHKEPPEFAELLAQRPPAVANLARRLRLAALKAIPDLTERFYPGWEGLGLRHPKAGLLGTVSPRQTEVVVYLERGAALPDPHGLLGGDGRLRQTRTLTFRPGQRTPGPAHLVEYLDLAVDHAVAVRRR